MNGPFEPGIYNDIAIFRSALLTELDEGEQVEADDGYMGEAPRYVKCPGSIARREDTDQCRVLCAVVKRLSTKDSNNLVC